MLPQLCAIYPDYINCHTYQQFMNIKVQEAAAKYSTVISKDCLQNMITNTVLLFCFEKYPCIYPHKYN